MAPRVLSAIYRGSMALLDPLVPAKMKPMWNHPAGPKTIFFWAPTFKWALVIAGIADINRPAERLSLYQSSALTVTGAVWSRYSLVVIPKNWLLFAVNIFVCATGAFQLSKIFQYRQSLPAIEAPKK